MEYIPTQQENLEFAQTSSAIEREFSDAGITDHLAAWEYMLTQPVLTLENVLECHRILCHRINKRIAGKLRDCNVMVGGRVCPDYNVVPALLRGWLNKFSDPYMFAALLDVDGETRVAHVDFEHIHPFEDGNGRTGRILMNWHRVKNDIPPLIIHPGEEQYSYYEWFR